MSLTEAQLELERARLLFGPGELPSTSLVAIHAKYAQAPYEAYERVRSVMREVVSHTASSWPRYDEWIRHLPQWFVDACSTTLSESEVEAFLARWRASSPVERASMEAQQPWELEEWLYSMAPYNRAWTWWDARVELEAIFVTIQVYEWPVAWGGLAWLLRASGAQEVDLV